MNMKLLPLLPSIKNPRYWYPDRPSGHEWKKIRKAVLERDKGRCRYCGHKGTSHMQVHHLNAGNDNRLANLVTCCGPCHVVQHIGRNLSLGLIEIWQSGVSQCTIIRETRKGIKDGKTLSAIKKELKKKYNLKKGIYPVGSVEYANMLLPKKKSKTHSFYLPEPYKVIFTRIKRWNIEEKKA
jgi:hypothetical protein